MLIHLKSMLYTYTPGLRRIRPGVLSSIIQKTSAKRSGLSRQSPKGGGGNKFIRVICLTALMACSTMHAMDTQDQLGQLLIDTASSGNLELVQQLLAQGAGVDAKDHHGQTPLIEAARNGRGAVCRLLIAEGAPVDAIDNYGWTPLIFAARNGHEAVCRLLIANDAAVEAKDDLGWTPLIGAALKGHEGVCRLLIAHNASVDAKNNNGLTPLISAARNGHEAACKLLIDAMAQSIQNRIQKSRARAIALLGMKKHRAPAYLNLIDRNIVKLIAQQVHAPAIQQQRSLLAQINAIENTELKQELLAYARQQLQVAQNSNQGIAHE